MLDNFKLYFPVDRSYTVFEVIQWIMYILYDLFELKVIWWCIWMEQIFSVFTGKREMKIYFKRGSSSWLWCGINCWVNNFLSFTNLERIGKLYFWNYLYFFCLPWPYLVLYGSIPLFLLFFYKKHSCSVL